MWLCFVWICSAWLCLGTACTPRGGLAGDVTLAEPGRFFSNVPPKAVDRHGGRRGVAFVDGHAAMIGDDQSSNVVLRED